MATYTNQAATKDNFLNKALPDNNNGVVTSARLFGSTNLEMRILATFNVSDFPANMVIHTAKFSLNYFLYGGANPVGRQVDVFKQTRNDWLEGTGNNAAGDSSWNQYKTGSAWTTAGGDYVTSNPAGVSTNMPAGYGWVDWDIKAIVKDAIANVGSIVNVLARFTNEANASQSTPYFHTREYATASLRPKLVISYSEGGEVVNNPTLLTLGVG